MFYESGNPRLVIGSILFYFGNNFYSNGKLNIYTE